MRRFLAIMYISLSGAFLAGNLYAHCPAAEEVKDTSSVNGGIIAEASVNGTVRRPAVNGQRIGEEILRSSVSIADALRSGTGLQVKDYGGAGGLKTVNIRSLGSEHTAVFIDGIAIDNAQNMQVDLGRFPVDGLASVEVFNGHRSMVLQSAREYAAAGSVYLNPATPVFSGGRRIRFTGRVRGGSMGTVSPSFKADFQAGKSSFISMGAEFLTSNGKYRYHTKKYITLPGGGAAGYDTTMTRRGGDITSVRAELRAGGNGERSQWNASAYYYESGRGLPGPVVRSASMLPGEGDRQDDRDIYVQGSYRIWGNGKLRPQGLFRGRFTRNRSHYNNNPLKNPQAMPVDVTYRQTSGYISASGALELFRWWTVNIAADAQYASLDGNPERFARPERLSFWGAAATDFHWKWGQVSASAVYNLAADRYDNTDAGAFSRQDRTRDSFSPSLQFHLSPFGTGRGPAVDGFIKRTFRMPSFNDLYYTTIGNAALRPETASQYDLGLSWPITAGQILIVPKAEVYHNYVKDKIVALPSSSQFRWTMFNIGRVRTFGSDISVSMQRDIKEVKTSLTTKYSYQKSVDRTDRGSASFGGQIPYIPLHSGSISASAGWKGWQADVCAVFTGGRWSSSANFSDYHIDRWVTCDASVSKTVAAKSRRIENGNLRFSLNLRNLTNSQYQVVQGYPMPGFNLFAGIEYSF